MTQPQLLAQTEGRRPSSRPLAVATGASGGIGLELARILAREGYDLVLVARSLPELERIARELSANHNVGAEASQADLSDPAAPRQLFEAVSARGRAVDILINNAGFGLAGRFDQTDGTRELEMIQVNVAAVTELTKLFLPGMIQRGRGRIMNVASTAAFQPGPLMAVYYATKAYVLSFTQAVAEELRDTGVTLTALCPGPTHTGFAKIANMQGTRLFNSPLTMGARDVAEYGYRAMMRGHRVAIPGVFNRLGAFATRLAPRRVLTKLARLAQENR
ncbi:MAG: SDR family NAD(P)-dependent oxidoreductase [Gemmatimonadaceae bacterium]